MCQIGRVPTVTGIVDTRQNASIFVVLIVYKILNVFEDFDSQSFTMYSLPFLSTNPCCKVYPLGNP
jgi:hypothetical protein